MNHIHISNRYSLSTKQSVSGYSTGFVSLSQSNQKLVIYIYLYKIPDRYHVTTTHDGKLERHSYKKRCGWEYKVKVITRMAASLYIMSWFFEPLKDTYKSLFQIQFLGNKTGLHLGTF